MRLETALSAWVLDHCAGDDQSLNVDHLEEIARLLLEEVGLPKFSTNDAFPCGATDRSDRDVTLDLEQKNKAMRVLSELPKCYEGRILANAGPLSMAQGITSKPGRGTLSSCGGVYRQLAILLDGTIVPCHMLSTLLMWQDRRG